MDSGESGIDWGAVSSVLVIRLRSIGDTALATPSLIALRSYLPDAEIDVLLEDWVAPLLEGQAYVSKVLRISRSKTSRLKTAWNIRKRGYDAVFDLHGGSTSSLLTRFSGAKYRIGYSHYRFPNSYNSLLSSASAFWKKEKNHSAEQMMALIGFAGIPVDKSQRSELAPTCDIAERKIGLPSEFALFHPAAAFATKQWPSENFARAADFLAGKGIKSLAIGIKSERGVLEAMKEAAGCEISIFDGLSLPEIISLASKAKIFIGNDSGIAHIASALNVPSVVVFGSSNRNHWTPWQNVRSETVFNPLPCQPCAGYSCKEFGEPRCILGISFESVEAAIERVLEYDRS